METGKEKEGAMKGYKMSIMETKKPPLAPIPKEDPEKEEEKKKLLEALKYDDGEKTPTICSICKAMLEYNGLGEYVCPDCGHKEYDSYGMVRNYLEKYPGANILQVEKATGIPRQKITKMIAEDRFRVAGGNVSMQ